MESKFSKKNCSIQMFLLFKFLGGSHKCYLLQWSINGGRFIDIYSSYGASINYVTHQGRDGVTICGQVWGGRGCLMLNFSLHFMFKKSFSFSKNSYTGWRVRLLCDNGVGWVQNRKNRATYLLNDP